MMPISFLNLIDGFLGKTLPAWRDRCKISLSMIDNNRRRLVEALKTDGLAGIDVERSYWSHYQGKQNFKIGDVVLGFVQLENREHWLFTTAGVIKSIPANPGPCDYQEISELACFKGRLVLKIDKGNTYSRYVFKLNNFIEKHSLEVLELYSSELAESVDFPGYDRCRWNFETLLKILDGSKRYSAIRQRLSEVKGVYLLKDQLTGKEYYGSAYGKDGIAQRWKCYLDTSTGGNKGLIELYSKLGPEYFKKNFMFSLQDWFDMKTPDKIVLEQESWRKDEHMSREFGYNRN